MAGNWASQATLSQRLRGLMYGTDSRCAVAGQPARAIPACTPISQSPVGGQRLVACNWYQQSMSIVCTWAPDLRLGMHMPCRGPSGGCCVCARHPWRRLCDVAPPREPAGPWQPPHVSWGVSAQALLQDKHMLHPAASHPPCPSPCWSRLPAVGGRPGSILWAQHAASPALHIEIKAPAADWH